jgi:uncharacterized protein (TIGR00255 family)
MLKSMTAYGRSCVVSPLGRFSVEIQSVNRKHLEINTALPSEFLRFDAEVKKWISSVVGRGQVNVKIHVAFEKTSPLAAVPNIGLALQIQHAWQLLAKKLNLTLEDEELIEILAQTDDIILFDEDLKDEESYKKNLQQAVVEALIQLSVMKDKEGQALMEDISRRLNLLEVVIKKIAEKAPGATTRYREKLKERLQEVMEATEETEERILREVCLFADKIDIAEELTRFDSHLVQMDQLINSSSGQAVGKTLEFLIQELNREVNTIGSKSSDADVSRYVIEIKTELERIREQIQNIE